MALDYILYIERRYYRKSGREGHSVPHVRGFELPFGVLNAM